MTAKDDRVPSRDAQGLSYLQWSPAGTEMDHGLEPGCLSNE
jgi:hypothetical protein